MEYCIVQSITVPPIDGQHRTSTVSLVHCNWNIHPPYTAVVGILFGIWLMVAWFGVRYSYIKLGDPPPADSRRRDNEWRSSGLRRALGSIIIVAKYTRRYSRNTLFFQHLEQLNLQKIWPTTMLLILFPLTNFDSIYIEIHRCYRGRFYVAVHKVHTILTLNLALQITIHIRFIIRRNG